MGFWDMMSISASALSAERQRAEVTSANLANAETTHTEDGDGPYVRKEVVFSATNASPGCVVAARRRCSTPPPVMRYDPGNPDANKEGYVAYPAINPVTEMVDLMDATRAYQLNASAITSAKQMVQESIDILKAT